jgi:hypothetical protein
MGNTMTKKSSELRFAFLDGDSVRIRRHLRLVTALLQIGDPKVEEALTVILERLAAAARACDEVAPRSPGPAARQRRKAPQVSDSVTNAPSNTSQDRR